jgi:hypothetical protein
MILNIGCGNDREGDVRLDIEPSPTTNLIADAHNLPVRALFTKIKCYNVLEHLNSPVRALKEMRRSLWERFHSYMCPQCQRVKTNISQLKEPAQTSQP